MPFRWIVQSRAEKRVSLIKARNVLKRLLVEPPPLTIDTLRAQGREMAVMKRAMTILILTAALIGCTQSNGDTSMASEQWPNTTAPDKTDPYWEFNNNMNANGTPYKKVEVSPGKWEWRVDEVSLKASHDYDAHKRQIYKALRTRVLSDAELQEALDYGDYLNVEPMVGYTEAEKSKELNDAFVTQHKLALLERQFKAGTLKP